MIDIYLLEQLVAVKQYKTLIRAAEAIGISQPALSKSMKKLEDLLQLELFHRTNRKIELNETGQFLAKKAERYLAGGEAMLTQVQDFARSQKNIAIGSCAPIPLWEILPIFSAAFPQFSMTTEIATDEQLLNGLQRDKYQMAVLSYAPASEEYFSAKFLSEQMFLSVPKNHPFYDKESISPSELVGQFLIISDEIGVWSTWIKENFPGVHLIFVEDSSSLREAIGLGAALSFVSDYIIRTGRNNSEQKIVPIAMAMEKNKIEYYFVCKKTAYSKYRKAIQRLLSATRD